MRRSVMILGILALAILGCDDLTVVRRTSAGVRQETRSVYCSYPSYCYSGGKFGFHYACPGNRQAEVSVQSFVVRYKSGRISTEEQVSVMRYLTDCR